MICAVNSSSISGGTSRGGVRKKNLPLISVLNGVWITSLVSPRRVRLIYISTVTSLIPGCTVTGLNCLVNVPEMVRLSPKLILEGSGSSIKIVGVLDDVVVCV